MMLRVPAVFALWTMTGAVPLWGQTPKSLDQVPLYPGATRQPVREAEEADQPGTVRVYRVNAGIEDVVRFYQQRLQSREITSDAVRERAAAEPERLAVGQTTGVWLDLVSVDLTPSALAEAAGGDRSPEQLAAAMRAAYSRARQPFHPGVWLESADLSWQSRSSATQWQEFNIGIEDVEAWELLEPSYHNETEIVIKVQPQGETVAEAEPEEPAPATPLKAPSEAELGVPLYPGARFEGRMSAELSRSDEEANYYVYASSDAPELVTRFYESRTGKKGLTNEGGVLFVVRGEGLFPDLGVTIQPNVGTFPATVKTVLTMRKRR